MTNAITANHLARNHDPIDKIVWKMSLVTKILIIIATIMAAATGQQFLIMSGMIALIFMITPALIERTWRVYLPVELDAFVTVFIFIHFILGEMNQYYDKITWFDFVLHGTSGIVVSLLGFLIIYTFLSMNRLQAKYGIISLFTISLAMGIGAIWEIFEFSMDYFFKFNMQKTGLVDTMWDLIATLIGAILVSIAGYRYMRTQEKRGGIIDRLVRKMMNIKQKKI